MRLKKYTDYSLRVLVYVGSKEDGELSSIKEISDSFGISQNHLSKIVHELSKLGLIDTIRGRGGGMRLAIEPVDINVGHVVRNMEDDFTLVEWLGKSEHDCGLNTGYALTHIFNDALTLFLQELDKYSLYDVLMNTEEVSSLMGIGE
ncbi:Rrf2 family transcriptional regulator [Pontibacillus sp. HMF3514]|uniref:RrF2 family transcriptional regulator n=1 Tax=Pontibacillus sp. HMF3514 TaxID=2692425 RepID=UPI0013202C4E|nr:Rrf2 family transcriptional regulator [Pontibacillus sp. HMF3514]QHE50592.1 Rrf2 family transcriptional regulator [Pontibacillus sp. HMF3514]